MLVRALGGAFLRHHPPDHRHLHQPRFAAFGLPGPFPGPPGAARNSTRGTKTAPRGKPWGPGTRCPPLLPSRQSRRGRAIAPHRRCVGGASATHRRRRAWRISSSGPRRIASASAVRRDPPTRRKGGARHGREMPSGGPRRCSREEPEARRGSARGRAFCRRGRSAANTQGVARGESDPLATLASAARLGARPPGQE